MNNNIKIVVTDMDGTFLNSKKEMHKDSFKIIDKLIEKGIYFVVASGRQYFNLYERFNKNNNIIYVAENGAYTVKNNEILNFSGLDKDFVKKVLEEIEKLDNTYIILCGKKSSYIKKMPEHIFKSCSEYYDKVKIVEDFNLIDDEFCKIAIYNEFGTNEYVYPTVEKYKDEYGVVVSAFEWLDIFDKSINKGSAIKLIQKLYNIEKEEIMAFGDYLNDYELIEVSGESYVMSNGHDELKKIAKYVINSNDEFDVIRVIKEKFNI